MRVRLETYAFAKAGGERVGSGRAEPAPLEVAIGRAGPSAGPLARAAARGYHAAMWIIRMR